MGRMHDPRLAILRDLVSQPTAPLHEGRPAAHVRRFLSDLGLPLEVDTYGNVLCHYQRGRPAQSLALVAHLDHPALEITGVNRARLLGGVDTACFDHPVPLRIVTAGGEARGWTGAYSEGPDGLELAVGADGPVTPGDFAVWDLPDFERHDDRLVMRTADDLAGCGAILCVFQALVESGENADLWAVFTRAEEVGLVGASLIAREGRLPHEALVVSIECSRELPGALLGRGPVIRVGDARTTFHPEGERLLHLAARRLRELRPEALAQRQLMSGGTCEATAFATFGYRTAGLAFPLENYHNVAPDQTLQPEVIHAADFLTGVDLLVEAVRAAHDPIPPNDLARLTGYADRYAPLLIETRA